jgi:hypothetical protein
MKHAWFADPVMKCSEVIRARREVRHSPCLDAKTVT